MDGPKKILLLEDDDLIRPLFTEQLQGAGFEVDSFSLGKDALEAAFKKTYDLLLLDILLPDTNGLEVLKELKKNPSTKMIKAVMLTNLGQDTVIKEAYELGAVGYIIKSAYNPDQIVAEIKKFLDSDLVGNNSTPPIL